MSQYPPQQPWGLPPEQPGQWGQQQPSSLLPNYSQPVPPQSSGAWQQQPNMGYPTRQQWPQQAQMPSPYPQPGQYQQPYYPPGPGMMSPPLPKKKGDRTALLISILVAVILLSSGGIVAIMLSITKGTDSIGNTATIQATQSGAGATVTPIGTTTQVNVIPTALPTATSASKNTVGSQAVIGTTLDAFTTKHGQPFDTKTNTNGTTTYKFHGTDGKIAEIDVLTYPNSQRIYAIIIGTPNNQSWDALTTLTECIAFLPEDVKLEIGKTVKNASGVDVGLYQPGSSVELKNTLPSSDFVDADTGSTVKPGTFS